MSKITSIQFSSPFAPDIPLHFVPPGPSEHNGLAICLTEADVQDAETMDFHHHAHRLTERAYAQLAQRGITGLDQAGGLKDGDLLKIWQHRHATGKKTERVMLLAKPVRCIPDNNPYTLLELNISPLEGTEDGVSVYLYPVEPASGLQE